MVSYYRRLWGTAFMILGAYFGVEHVYQWGFQFWDFIGHEWLALLLFIGGAFIAIDMKGGKKK